MITDKIQEQENSDSSLQKNEIKLILVNHDKRIPKPFPLIQVKQQKANQSAHSYYQFKNDNNFKKEQELFNDVKTATENFIRNSGLIEDLQNDWKFELIFYSSTQGFKTLSLILEHFYTFLKDNNIKYNIDIDLGDDSLEGFSHIFQYKVWENCKSIESLTIQVDENIHHKSVPSMIKMVQENQEQFQITKLAFQIEETHSPLKLSQRREMLTIFRKLIRVQFYKKLTILLNFKDSFLIYDFLGEKNIFQHSGLNIVDLEVALSENVSDHVCTERIEEYKEKWMNSYENLGHLQNVSTICLHKVLILNNEQFIKSIQSALHNLKSLQYTELVFNFQPKVDLIDFYEKIYRNPNIKQIRMTMEDKQHCEFFNKFFSNPNNKFPHLTHLMLHFGTKWYEEVPNYHMKNLLKNIKKCPQLNFLGMNFKHFNLSHLLNYQVDEETKKAIKKQIVLPIIKFFKKNNQIENIHHNIEFRFLHQLLGNTIAYKFLVADVDNDFIFGVQSQDPFMEILFHKFSHSLRSNELELLTLKKFGKTTTKKISKYIIREVRAACGHAKSYKEKVLDKIHKLQIQSQYNSFYLNIAQEDFADVNVEYDGSETETEHESNSEDDSQVSEDINMEAGFQEIP